jgi:hypothetical protein
MPPILIPDGHQTQLRPAQKREQLLIVHPVFHNFTRLLQSCTSARSAVETLNSPTPAQVGSSTGIGDFEERIQKHEDGRRKDRQLGEHVGDARDTAKEGEDGDGDGENTMGIDLTRDGHTDPTPSAFRPYHLASLVDPKKLDALEAMGGITGLL